jgi:hypothetical protein
MVDPKMGQSGKGEKPVGLPSMHLGNLNADFRVLARNRKIVSRASA